MPFISQLIPSKPRENQEQVRPLVCFIGTLRALDLTASSLMSNLIGGLNADVAVCVSRMTPSDEQQLSLLKGVRIVDTCIYEEADQGYASVCDALTNKILPTQSSIPWRKALAIEGNWLGGLLGRQGSGMHLNFNYYKLHQRLSSPDIAAKKYTHFIVTRTDFSWMAPHPPLHLFDNHLIWIPEGEDYHGFNDRHAVCSRRNIMTFLGFFETLLSGQALTYLSDYQSLNHEYQLKLYLNFCGIRVGRFKNLAYLTGSPTTATNCASITSKTIEGTMYNCKYPGELDSSITNSTALATHRDVNKLIIKPSRIRSRLPIWITRIRYSNPHAANLLNKIKKTIRS